MAKVTFYRPAVREAREALGAVVWNPQANAPLADFSLAGGKFETEDPKVVAKLRELGYPEVGIGEEVVSEPPKAKWVKSDQVGKKPGLKTRKKASPSSDMDADVPPR